MQNRTAVSKDYDFHYNGQRYQVIGNRPSGKPGSPVTLVNKKKKYDWDYLIWVHYFENYDIREAWLWKKAEYKKIFAEKKRISPADMRRGKQLTKRDPFADFENELHTDKIDEQKTIKGKKMTQRDKMRELYRHRSNDIDTIIQKYVEAEKQGEVQRNSNSRLIDAYEYAKRLLSDGLRKGWIKSVT